MSQVTGSCGAPCYTIFLEATLSGVNYSDRSSYQLRGGRSQVPIYATVFSRGRLAELTYVRLLLVVHGSLRATFMWRQYSSLDTARAVMSRWRNYVIGPRGALPILPLLQLLLPRLPQGVVLLSARASIWEHTFLYYRMLLPKCARSSQIDCSEVQRNSASLSLRNKYFARFLKCPSDMREEIKGKLLRNFSSELKRAARLTFRQFRFKHDNHTALVFLVVAYNREGIYFFKK